LNYIISLEAIFYFLNPLVVVANDDDDVAPADNSIVVVLQLYRSSRVTLVNLFQITGPTKVIISVIKSYSED
jgi:hypothetical protein